MPDDKRDLRKEILEEIKDSVAALNSTAPVQAARAKERMRTLLWILTRIDDIKAYNEA